MLLWNYREFFSHLFVLNNYACQHNAIFYRLISKLNIITEINQFT